MRWNQNVSPRRVILHSFGINHGFDQAGNIEYTYPNPKGQTHAQIDFMRAMLPSYVKLMGSQYVTNQLAADGMKVNWKVINDMEEAAGLPKSPPPF
jgi:hypothetical protein